MKKLIIGLYLAMIFLSANAAVENVRIHGIMTGLGNEEICLLNTDREEIARTTAKNDCFEFVQDLETGDLRFYILYVPSVGPLGLSMSIPTLYFFADSHDIEVRAEINDKKVRKLEIIGSPAEKEYSSLYDNLPANKELEIVMPEYNQAFHQYNEVEQSEANRKALTEAGDQIDKLQGELQQQMLELIPQHNKSMPLAVMVSQYCAYGPVDKVEAIYNQFDPSIRHCYYLEQIADKIALTKACAVGKPAPDFELNNLNGEPVKLSSLRGKYVLIDFWASWCGPCRKEIPNLKRVYAEFKDRGLQLVGVSIDENADRWRKAVKEENLDYLQLADPGMTTGKLYDYSGIPFIVLISPDGIILEKGLRGTEVGTKVAEHIK